MNKVAGNGYSTRAAALNKNMNDRLIQVAAPSAGLYMECGHDKTEWQRYSESFAVKPRLFFPVRNRPYVRPLAKTPKGKKACRAAKRAKVKAMKEATI